MKIKLTLTPEAAAAVRQLFQDGQLADIGVLELKEITSAKVKISVVSGELPEDVVESLRDKAKEVAQLFDATVAIEVIVDLKDAEKSVEFIVQNASDKHEFVARSRNDQVLVAADRALDLLRAALTRYRERQRDPSREKRSRRRH